MKDDIKLTSLLDPQLPSQLKDARRNNAGMTVPTDFFAQFERKMNAVIDADVTARQASEPQPALRPQTTVFSWRKWVSVAAAVVLIVGVSIALRSQQSGLNPADDPLLNNVMAQTVEAAEAEPETIELPEQVADELMACDSDYDVFDLYFDI